MSIASKLEKLTTDITNAYTSIENKGGTIPSDKNTDNLHTAIDSIEVIEQATAEGESLSLVNTKSMPYNDYVVEGKSTQDGEPSPSNPSDIHSVADDVNLFDIGTINDYKNYEDRADRVNWLTIENNKMICVVQDYGETLAYNNNFYFKPNTTYSFSLVYSSNETRFLIKLRNLQDTDWLTDSDTSIAGWTYNSYYKGWFVTNAQQKTVNIPNCLFGVLGFGFNSTTETTGTTQTISNIKIQEGSTSTPYSPYNQGTVTIKQRGTTESNDYIIQTEPLRSLPNGVKDTIEVDGIHRRVGVKIFNEDDNFYLGQTLENVLMFGSDTLDNSKLNVGDNNISMSNFFKILYDYTLDEEHFYYTNAGKVYFYINKTELSTQNVADFKTWLSTHNTEVLYPLAEEVIEPFTQQQATTYLDIIKTGSYEGTTNIYTDEDVKPTIGVGYYKKG